MATYYPVIHGHRLPMQSDWCIKDHEVNSMLQLEIRRQGPPAIEEVEVVGEITLADLAIANGPRQTTYEGGFALKRLSDRHHAVARAIASGMQDVTIAAMFGYEPSRISLLKADPTFQELVRGYAAG